MFIHFDLPCDRITQQKLHHMFRLKIQEWKEVGLIERAVLTYHFPNGSLYLCLDIPAVKRSTEQKIRPSLDEIKQIPKPIISSINVACKENAIKLGITDYEIEIEQAKKRSEEKGSEYYDGAPVKEVLQFASLGTQIALSFLQSLEIEKDRWHSDKELSDFIFLQLKEKLGTDYKWTIWALHFVCNPLLIPEGAILYPFSNRILEYLKNAL
jgi:hypothetical protein